MWLYTNAVQLHWMLSDTVTLGIGPFGLHLDGLLEVGKVLKCANYGRQGAQDVQ